jgi:hypothetical protein
MLGGQLRQELVWSHTTDTTSTVCLNIRCLNASATVGGSGHMRWALRMSRNASSNDRGSTRTAKDPKMSLTSFDLAK